MRPAEQPGILLLAIRPGRSARRPGCSCGFFIWRSRAAAGSAGARDAGSFAHGAATPRHGGPARQRGRSQWRHGLAPGARRKTWNSGDASRAFTEFEHAVARVQEDHAEHNLGNAALQHKRFGLGYLTQANCAMRSCGAISLNQIRRVAASLFTP